MSFCGNCGTQILEGQSFCSACGTRVGGDDPATSTSGASADTPAVAGVVYVGYRVKQKASAALDNLEGKAGKTSGQSGSGDGSGSRLGSKDDGSSGSDADNPLSAVLDKLQGGGGDSGGS